MLVLARKLNQTICVGDDVRITIVEIRSGRVRVGVEAPRHVRIRRDEVQSRSDLEFTEFERAAVALAEC